MALTIAFGVVIGGLTALGLRWREARVEQREARNRERLAVAVSYAAIKAAIESLELALRADRSTWRVSLAQSPTLTEAWREHGEALLGLGAERWSIISDAVSAVAAGGGRVCASGETADLQRLLTQRRELLLRGAAMLRSARDYWC